MALVTISSGKSFESPEDCSILDAAAQSQVTIPYSCKTGRCSTCKCKVVKGTTRSLYPETGLSEHERADGWVLSCVRVAETDLHIEVDYLAGVELPVPKTWPCRVDAVELLSSDVVRVFLRLPPNADFAFIPGQYIDVIGPNGVRRSYSLANASFAGKLLELHIRAVVGGVMSDYWFNHAKANDLLRLSGPLGTFFLRDTAGLDLIFLATGTGIAPVKAMLESIPTVPAVQMPRSVTVFWGGHGVEDLYFNIEAIPGTHKYVPVHSRPADDWMGGKGYVQDYLLSLAPDLSNAVVYACGSDSMINGAKQSLCSAGLPSKRFYSDAFVSSGITPET